MRSSLLKKLSSLFFIFLFLISLSALAQEGDQFNTDPVSDGEEVIIPEHQQIPAENNPLAELKKLGHENVTFASLMDERVVKLVQKMLRESHLKKLPREEVKKLITDRARGSMMEGILKSKPRILEAMVDVMQDEKAMGNLVGIFLRKDDLKIYFYVWLALMITGFLIRKFYINKKWKGIERTLIGLTFTLFLTGISLTVFYQIFHEELSPTAKILVGHFRRRNLPIN